MRSLETILQDLKQAKRAYIEQWDDSNGAELLTPGFSRWWESSFASQASEWGLTNNLECGTIRLQTYFTNKKEFNRERYVLRPAC